MEVETVYLSQPLACPALSYARSAAHNLHHHHLPSSTQPNTRIPAAHRHTPTATNTLYNPNTHCRTVCSCVCVCVCVRVCASMLS